MLPLLLKTHIWESNIWNGLVWCLQQHQPAPTPCRLSAFMFLLQEQCTGSRNASSWLRTGEKQRHKAGSDGSVTCVAVPGQRDEQEGLGICSELVLRRLRRGNKGRVENNRTWQGHWDNLWSYLGIFNWPVSFSHLMHFHEDSSLPLVLSSRSSLDSPADSLSAFLCFVSPPFPLQSSTELPGFSVWAERQIQQRSCLGESHVIVNKEGNLVQQGWLSVT